MGGLVWRRRWEARMCTGWSSPEPRSRRSRTTARSGWTTSTAHIIARMRTAGLANAPIDGGLRARQPELGEQRGHARRGDGQRHPRRHARRRTGGPSNSGTEENPTSATGAHTAGGAGGGHTRGLRRIGRGGEPGNVGNSNGANAAAGGGGVMASGMGGGGSGSGDMLQDIMSPNNGAWATDPGDPVLIRLRVTGRTILSLAAVRMQTAVANATPRTTGRR